MQLYLAAEPAYLPRALARTPHLAHAAFGIAPDGSLLEQELPPALRGGLMLLRCDGSFPCSCVENLGRDILRVCLRRHFSAVVLDFPGEPAAERADLTAQLDLLTQQQRRRLYVPEGYAAAAPHGIILICTAISGGSLQQRLEESAARYGPKRIALDLQRLAMDFPLPCPSGEGTPLTSDQLRQLKQGRAVFFSDELCARYFTCRRHGNTHFVLFDDADTLRRKMTLADALGIGEGFVMLPEVEDLLGQLFEEKKEAEP